VCTKDVASVTTADFLLLQLQSLLLIVDERSSSPRERLLSGTRTYVLNYTMFFVIRFTLYFMICRAMLCCCVAL
jgi:hypothetical protein